MPGHRLSSARPHRRCLLRVHAPPRAVPERRLLAPAPAAAQARAPAPSRSPSLRPRRPPPDPAPPHPAAAPVPGSCPSVLTPAAAPARAAPVGQGEAERKQEKRRRKKKKEERERGEEKKGILRILQNSSFFVVLRGKGFEKLWCGYRASRTPSRLRYHRSRHAWASGVAARHLHLCVGVNYLSLFI